MGSHCVSVKNFSGGTVELNALLDVRIAMPEHAGGSSESKDIAEVELDGCQTGADVHARIDEARQS